MAQNDTETRSDITIPSMEVLEAELRKEQYKSNYSRVLKSTIF